MSGKFQTTLALSVLDPKPAKVSERSVMPDWSAVIVKPLNIALPGAKLPWWLHWLKGWHSLAGRVSITEMFRAGVASLGLGYHK